MTYKSRVDWWIAALLVLPPLASAMVLATGEIMFGVIGLAGYGLLITSLVLPIEYTVGDKALVIAYGMARQRIAWDHLIAMRPSRNPLSSPALSLRRLEIKYRKHDGREATVLISPVDRAAFVADCARAAGKRADGESLG